MLLAQNNKPSNLTPEQYRLVRSPEFISWFGDWINSPETASKVVDENGEPLVVYHGTNKSFNGFESGEISQGSGNFGHHGYGFYFSNDIREAKGYGSNVLKCFLNIKKPFYNINDNFDLLKEKGIHDIDEKVVMSIDFDDYYNQMKSIDEKSAEFLRIAKENGIDKVWDIYLENNKTTDSKFDLNDLHDTLEYTTLFNKEVRVPDYILENIERMGITPKVNMGYEYIQSLHWITDLGNRAKEVTNIIKELGFDGVVIGSEYVPFESTQIKLADGSNTTFDGGNPDIRFDDGGQFGGGKFTLPENHKPFMKVPKGGSSCANCKFLSEDKKNCVNKHFIEWYGKSELPQPISEYCSDWFEPNEETYAKGGELKFYSDCVGYPVLSDLEHIIEHEKEIKYSTFVANVNKEDRLMLERRLGYGSHFPITKDWHVRFFKSKDEDGNTVYFIRHSAIEYVFSLKGGSFECEIDYKYGGQITSVKANDFVLLKYIDGDKQLGFLEYYFDANGVISIGLDKAPFNFNSEMYISMVEVEEEHRGKGIAKKLINEALKDAKEMGIEVVTLRRDAGMGCNYGSDYDNYLKKIYSSIGFVETWTEKDMEQSGGEKNICGMHLVVNENEFKKGGSVINKTDIPDFYIDEKKDKVFVRNVLHGTCKPFEKFERGKKGSTTSDDIMSNIGFNFTPSFKKSIEQFAGHQKMMDIQDAYAYKKCEDEGLEDGTAEFDDCVSEERYNIDLDCRAILVDLVGKKIYKADESEIVVEVLKLAHKNKLFKIENGDSVDKKKYNQLVKDDFDWQYHPHLVEAVNDFSKKNILDVKKVCDLFIEKLKKEGYDIIQYKNEIEKDYRFEYDFIVFDEKQIKYKYKIYDRSDYHGRESYEAIKYNNGGQLNDTDVENQLKLRQRMRTLLKLLKYKQVSGDENKTKEDLFIERVVALIYDGKDFKSKLDIERIAENEFGFEDKRKVRELTEYAVLFVGREISKTYGNDIHSCYKKMVSLYSNQPYSTHRTSTSVDLGQFSTPAPMAYLMGVYVGVNKE